jgi:hypothetical protein
MKILIYIIRDQKQIIKITDNFETAQACFDYHIAKDRSTKIHEKYIEV